MEITREQVSMIMASLSIRFPEAGYALPQLQMLSDEYYEDLKTRMNAAELEESYKTVRAGCRFFPKVVDFIEARPDLYNPQSLGMYKSFEHSDRISSKDWYEGSQRRAKRLSKEAEKRKKKFGNIKEAARQALEKVSNKNGNK